MSKGCGDQIRKSRALEARVQRGRASGVAGENDEGGKC